MYAAGRLIAVVVALSLSGWAGAELYSGPVAMPAAVLSATNAQIGDEAPGNKGTLYKAPDKEAAAEDPNKEAPAEESVVEQEEAVDLVPPGTHPIPTEENPAPAPEPGTNGGTEDEAPLTQEQMDLLHQKIDVNLIDTEFLQQVIEERVGAEQLRLSLDEAICIALEQNPDLQIARLEPLRADADVMTARGEFDPTLKSTANYLEAQQNVSTELVSVGSIPAVEVFETTTRTTLTGKLPTGTIYDVTLNVSKEETTYTSFFEQYDGDLTFTLSQPLLRGRGLSVNLARVRIAKNQRVASEYQVRLAMMNTVAQVVKAYWDLVGALENVTVREQALANAERLMDISQKRYEIGTAAAIEVLQAKAGVATRQGDLVSARSAAKDAGDVLKRLLNMRDNGVFSPKRIVPIDRPEVAMFTPEEIDRLEAELDSGLQHALELRPEILTAQIDIENARLERSRAANLMLPELNITGSLAQSDRDHKLREVFRGIENRDSNAYTVGIQGSVPIGNRAARGAFQRADVTKRQAEQRLERAKQEVMFNVRLALRNAVTSQILVESNQQAVTLQETNVAAEEKRLRLGVTTSYRVLQIQQDLTLAQTQEVQARIAHEKALVDFRLAEGTLLENLGIEYQPVEAETPVSFWRSMIPIEPK